MPTVLVTGANRGLVFEHVKQYAEKGWNVIACARNPEKADDLQALNKKYEEHFCRKEIRRSINYNTTGCKKFFTYKWGFSKKEN